MSFHTLVDVAQVAEHLANPRWVIVDCRFDLHEPEAGWRAYQESHIPGALYAHLDKDLSGPPVTDQGRHPLPTPDALNALFSRFGIAEDKQVVAYDGAGGGFAARLWWLLRYMGHEAVAVLDGGWQAWHARHGATESGVVQAVHTTFSGKPRSEWLVLAHDVPDVALLVDSREPARYRGEFEPLDPVAGHIPSAVNYCFQNNLTPNHRFLKPEQLRQQLEELLGDMPPEQAVYYCGSGVTACHNLLAQAHAGFAPGRLYAGSWSDWITDPARPIERELPTEDETPAPGL